VVLIIIVEQLDTLFRMSVPHLRTWNKLHYVINHADGTCSSQYQ
jgi:hypothetical protein